jgi:anti-sigma B factor antagonist
MQISERTIDGVTILDIDGRLMFGDGDRMLRDRINVLMHQGQRKLLLNLRDVTALDSAGVGILVWKYVTVTRQGGELKLVNLSSRAANVLMITKLLTVFEAYDSEATAIASFALGETEGELRGR